MPWVLGIGALLAAAAGFRVGRAVDPYLDRLAPDRPGGAMQTLLVVALVAGLAWYMWGRR